MSKILFSKIKQEIKVPNSIVTFGNENIEVVQYLPSSQKLALIGNVALNAIGTDLNYANALKVKIYYTMEIIMQYSNIEFEEEDLLDISLLYDNLVTSGLVEQIMQAIPETEKIELWNDVLETIGNMYKYQNSVLGIIHTLSEKYDATSFDLDKLQAKIQDPNTLKSLKEITGLLG